MWQKKFMSELYVFGWFPGVQNLDVFFGKFTVEQVLKSFSGRNNSLKPPVFGSCDSLPYDLEKSKELRALISWLSVYKHSKMQKISANNFLCFWDAIMDLLITLIYQFSFFLIYQGEFQPAKHYLSRISTSRNTKLKKS